MTSASLGLALIGVAAWAGALGPGRPAGSVFRRMLEGVAVQVVVSTSLSVALASIGAFRVTAAQALATALPLALLLRPRRSPWAGLGSARLISRFELVTVLILVLVAPVALPRMELLYMKNDAGVYSHRAIHHLFEGSLVADVPARSRLEGELLEAFDRDNFHSPPAGGSGHYLPGTYSVPGDANEFVFQFYPGWPLLMAQWVGIFGLSRMFDAVLLSFLLAVLFFAFLLESRGIGFAAFTATVALFASSPLLLYFSRYTTSEAFLLFLFLFVLYSFVRGGRIGTALALLGVLAIVVTHVSIFLYAPLLLLVALHGHVTADRRAASFAAGSFALLLAGIPLGLLFSRPYLLPSCGGPSTPCPPRIPRSWGWLLSSPAIPPAWRSRSRPGGGLAGEPRRGIPSNSKAVAALGYCVS